MLCPRCKKDIEDNSLTCKFCKTKIRTACKVCGTYNLLTSTHCSKCNETLLKICTECGAANLPKAEACRRCGIEFVSKEAQEDFLQSFGNEKMNSQQQAKAKLLEAIKNPDLRIITLSGESGSGKSLVLRSVVSELKSANLIWLMGTCSQVSQLSPFVYFQDLLLSFFNINNFCPDTLQLKKNSLRFFKQDFPTMSTNEIVDLLNFLYPDSVDNYENIYFNKSKMFSTLKKVILTIVEKMKIVFIVDNIEYIDGASYDFIKELLNEEIILNRTKFIFISSIQKHGLGVISTPTLEAENYLDIGIAPFTSNQIQVFLKQYTEFEFGNDFINLAIKISRGNPSIIEQMVLLSNDIKSNNLKNLSYSSLDSILSYRLEILKNTNRSAYRLLIAMSILGFKFYPAILENFDNNSLSQFEDNIDFLRNKGFISQLNNLSFEFKSLNVWKSVVACVKNDESFEEILNILYETINIYKQSSLALLAYITQKLNNNDEAFGIWTLLMKQASYIGDVGLYIITQKQALKLIENKAGDYYQKIKKNIYTRVGKLLEPIDPQASFDYIQKALVYLKDEDFVEQVELLGYLSSSAMKLGNYSGVIECIESLLKDFSLEPGFEQTLIKTRLVSPLLCLGNCGQLINIVETEILNELEAVLAKGRDTSLIKIKDLFETWVKVYLKYAEALVLQGDSKAFDVINVIYDILEKNKPIDPALLCKTNLLLAFANTIKGDVKTSNKILDDILKDFSLDKMDSYIVSRWNFIDVLNKFFLKDYITLHSELFNVASYANNVNDNFTKNILKTLLAKILKENNQTKKALEILEEQVAYFAKEKIAIGVLLSWYLIAEIKLITNGTQYALDIANKALDIAQSPNINNYYFIALFNKLIGEIYLAKQDFDSAKVYFEKTIFIATSFDLQYILVKAYLSSAKLYQELALPKSSSRTNYIKQALKMFQNAKNISIVSEQTSLQKNIKEDLNVLTSFCKLNGIVLKRENN